MLLPVVIAISIGAPLVGRILDRTGSKVLMVSGGLMLSVGLLIFGTTGYNFSFFVLSGILIGLGLSALLGAPVRYIMINEFPESERASGQGLLNINASAGQLIGGALIGAVLESLGGGVTAFGSAYLFLAGSAIILTIMALGLKGKRTELEMMER